MIKNLFNFLHKNNSNSTLKQVHGRYFDDRKRKIDYIVVHLKNDESKNLLDLHYFFLKCRKYGLEFEHIDSKIFPELVFHKVHAPKKVLEEYIKTFNINLSANSPHKTESELSRSQEYSLKYLPNVEHQTITDFERSLVVYKIMCEKEAPNDLNLESLIRKNAIITAYPLHDPITESKTDLNNRQLLLNYWGNMRSIFTMQPLYVVESYYGPEVAFYFAWLGFYTKMLVLASIFGLISLVTGFIFIHFYIPTIVDEVCNSPLLICPQCPQRESCPFEYFRDNCHYAKYIYTFDNPVIILYIVFMTFWGPTFITLWKRKEAKLRLQWNLHRLPVDTLDFNLDSTAKIHFALPKLKKIYSVILSNLVVFLMMFLYAGVDFTLMIYKHTLIKRESKYITTKIVKQYTEISDKLIFAFMLFIISKFFHLLTKLISHLATNIALKLTLLEKPRTQLQFDRLYTWKIFCLTFAYVFFPIAYVAFLQGSLYTYPSDTDFTFFGLLKSNSCKPTGCMTDLSIVLIVFFVSQSIVRLIKTTVVPYFKVVLKRYSKGVLHKRDLPQWEEEYLLEEFDQYTLNDEFEEIVIQYGYVIFFLAGFPIAPILAFIQNIFEIRFDAYKFLTCYRRPKPRKVPNIGAWNTILKTMTIFGAVSNAAVLAFTSDLIPSIIYYIHHGYSMRGFIDSTFSVFYIGDYGIPVLNNTEKVCYYKGYRYPPNHHSKYELTDFYWYQLAWRCLFFIILEKLCVCFSIYLSNVIPPIPTSVQLELENEEEERTRKTRQNLSLIM